MTPKQKILLALLGAGMLALILTVAFLPRAKHTTAHPTPSATSTATATIAPHSTSTPTPTPVPTSPTPGGLGDDGSTDGDGGGTATPAPSVTSYKKAADAAVLAYTTVKAGESVAARSARLAPYFRAGSPLLTTPPLIANPSGYSDITSTVTPSTRAVASLESETDTEYTFMVVLSYAAHYDLSGQIKDVIAGGIWHVTMAKKFDGKMLTIIEPENMQ
jgi:hypothetical protein